MDDIIVKFNEAAFRHGIIKEDILHALKTKIHDFSIGEFPEKNLVIGFDRAGNPLELLYNPISDNTIYVFHAMKVRNSTIEMARTVGSSL
jgi:hypothetical protein